MLKFGCILVYLKYWTLNFMPLWSTLKYYSIQYLASKSKSRQAMPEGQQLASSLTAELFAC